MATKSYPERRKEEIKNRDAKRQAQKAPPIKLTQTEQQRKEARWKEPVVPIPKKGDCLHFVRLSDCRRDWHLYHVRLGRPNTTESCEQYIETHQRAPFRSFGNYASSRPPGWYLGQSSLFEE